MKLRCALAQIAVTDDIQDNFCRIERALRHAAKEKANILLTPEGSLSGYNHTFNRGENRRALKEVEALAASLHVGLALGTCNEEDDGKCYNELRFYDPEGNFLGFHTKTLCCGSMTEPSTGEINHYHTKPLRTFNFCGLTIGGLICNDMWANPQCTPMPDPHLSWQLAKMGAKVIFHAVNGGNDGSAFITDTIIPYHFSNLKMRAEASGLYIVSVDNAGVNNYTVTCPGGVISPEGKQIFALRSKGEDLGTFEVELS